MWRKYRFPQLFVAILLVGGAVQNAAAGSIPTIQIDDTTDTVKVTGNSLITGLTSTINGESASFTAKYAGSDDSQSDLPAKLYILESPKGRISDILTITSLNEDNGKVTIQGTFQSDAGPTSGGVGQLGGFAPSDAVTIVENGLFQDVSSPLGLSGVSIQVASGTHHPEPASITLVGIAIACAAGYRCRCRHKLAV
jgi:hypothetical protein